MLNQPAAGPVLCDWNVDGIVIGKSADVAYEGIRSFAVVDVESELLMLGG